MLPLLALVVAQAQAGQPFRQTKLDGILGPQTLMIQTRLERLATPKLSPKQKWEFDWPVAGYVGDKSQLQLRFDVYSQESTQSSTRAENVTRLLLRLYSYNYARLGLEHAPDFNRIVSVYLCYGGDPGGEQLVGVDPQLEDAKVNSIYFYDLSSFTNPVEMVREVAHEYGHATLPPVGGYEKPENWSNGYLGEKLYLKYIADALDSGELSAADVFGATPAALHAWVKSNVDPLVNEALVNGPRPTLIAGKDKAAMDAGLGLALATAQLYGPKVMVRALFMNGAEAKDYPASAATAAEEPELSTLRIPAALAGQPIWAPVGDGTAKELAKRVSGATVLEAKLGWARLKPTSATNKIVVRGVKR